MTDIEITEINVAYPEATDLHLRLSLGACRLQVSPGEGEEWVKGTYKAPTGALPVKIAQEGGTVRISQEYRMTGLSGVLGSPPVFELALGMGRPYELTLELGAVESKADLGGIPIRRLTIKQGAGKFAFDFSAPNPEPMSLLELQAGAVGLEMANLANANFAEMKVDGGAAAYKFDFGGTLSRDANARFTVGVSSLEISAPASTAAKIRSESVLSSMNVGDGFTKKEGAFWTSAALAGDAPVLTIHANVSVGSLAIHVT